MKQIEPNLLYSELYVKLMNKNAINEEVYWFKVWSNCKRFLIDYIGNYAENTLLQSSQCWDKWHDYLKSLSTNCI